MSTAAVFFADGFEMIEALSPVDYMRRAGIEVVTVAVVSGSEDRRIVRSSHGVSMFTDMTFDGWMDSCGSRLPDAVVCPGGSTGAENLGADVRLLRCIEECNAAGKIVAAICASPAVVLGKTSVLAGRKWTCYPGMQDRASGFGGGYSDLPVVVDGNVVTARGAGASEEFAMELVRILAGAETAARIRKGTCQR